MDADLAAARRAVLAAVVLDDLDAEAGDDGVLVHSPAGRAARLPWAHVARAVAAHPPESLAARLRVGTLLHAGALLADGPDAAAVLLERHGRVVALPEGHVLHPGRAWVRQRVLGGALDAGVGLADPPWPRPRGRSSAPGTDAGADTAVPLPPWLAVASPLGGRDPVAAWWPRLRAHADRMAGLAAARGAAGGGEPGVLRPVGGCDVLTLLTGAPLRAALAAGDGSGLRAVAVPARTRGWYDLRRVDPAYVGAAWSATDAVDRGVDRPLLVTRDEVTLPRVPAAAAVRDALR